MDKILGWIREKAGPFPCGRWLGYGWFVELVVWLAADARLSSYITSAQWRCCVYFAIFVSWGCIWLALRCILPRAGRHVIGVVVAIDTDGSAAEAQFRDDLVRQLRETVSECGLAYNMRILMCNPAQSRVANTILGTLRAEDMAKNTSPQDPKKPSGLGWQWLTRGTRGKLFIWGGIRTREGTDASKYWLDLYALARHASVDMKVGQAMQTEFGSVWLPEFCIDPQAEVYAAKFMGNWLALASLYLVGLAAFASGDIDTAFVLHSKVVSRLSESNQKLPLAVQTLSEHARDFVVEEACILVLKYMREENASQCMSLLAQALALKPDCLTALILKARVEWTLLSDMDAAMQSVRQAKALSGGTDCTWRYDYAFLLMQQKKYPEALKEYKKIANTRWLPGEEQVVASVVDFFEEYIVKQPKNATHEFALAFILYKRQHNSPNALFHFDEFLRKSADDRSLDALRERALSYSSEISHELRLRRKRDQQTP